MILVPHCSGQTCNKICYFVQALATALECRRGLVYFFGKDLHLFSDLHPEAVPEINVICLDRQRSKVVDGICGLLQNKIPGMRKRYYETNVARIVGYVRRPKWIPIILWNWYFRNDVGIVRYREQICAYLRARDPFVVRAKGIVSAARKKSSLVIGLHVRRGDYKTAFEGRYYFSDEDYLHFMKSAERSFGRRLAFVAVSNEPLDVAFFAKRGLCVTDASGTTPEDIVTLSECDLVMGPPSTFSWWAAYYGGKPRLLLDDRKMDVDKGAFRPVCRLESAF